MKSGERRSPLRQLAALTLVSAAFLFDTSALFAQPADVTAIAGAAPESPALLDIKSATLTTPDLDETIRHYNEWLGYRVRERGRLSRALARSWGAPRMADKKYALLSSDAAPDSFIRVIELRNARPVAPLTTYGWNAIELIVNEPVSLFDEIRRSPFKIIGEPAPLGSYPTIVAFQAVGYAGEVIYLTAETGDRSKSILPLPNGKVGRVFIMVLAASDVRATLDWYAKVFSLTPGPLRIRPNRMINRAQGLPPDAGLPIATARLGSPGNLIEFDGYSDKASRRPTSAGELPSGVVMTTFTTRKLDELQLPWISPPARHKGLAYNGRRAATALGPDGELIEIIEE